MDYIVNEYDDEADSESHHPQLEILNPIEVSVIGEWPGVGVIDWRILQKLDFHKASRIIVDELLESNIHDLLLYDLLPELLKTNQVSQISD